MYIYREEKSPKDIEKSFCETFGVKKQRITDAKFLKILSECWKLHIDMNFDNNPDFEDLESIRNSDYKYYILDHMVERFYISNMDRSKLETSLQQVLGEEE
jgi:hypothetical protein